MMSESRYFPPPSFSLGMNHYDDNLDFFSHKQHLIKVEPEVSSRRPTSKSTVSFYNCTDLTESNSSSSDHGSPEDIKRSPLILSDVEPSTEKNGINYLKSKMAQACKICGKVLSSASSYYVHMKQHSGNKPFQCPVCEASFCRKPYLEVHMRTHTGERPFQCNLCLKRFTQKSSLNTHKRVHTGERPYSCDICHKRFAVKSYVSAHRWSHVADKPLQCEHCNQTFTSKAQYTIHARSHTPSHEFQCHLCGRSFVKDSFLIRHHYRVHRDMFPPSNDYEHIPFDMRVKTKPSNSSSEISKQDNTESA